jgi:hypothetical protein
VTLHRLAQPLFGNQGFHPGQRFDTAKVFAKGAVEFVEMGFVLDQSAAGQEVEIVEAVVDDALLQGFEQGQELLGRDREFLRFQVEEKVDQHACSPVSVASRKLPQTRRGFGHFLGTVKRMVGGIDQFVPGLAVSGEGGHTDGNCRLQTERAEMDHVLRDA